MVVSYKTLRMSKLHYVEKVSPLKALHPLLKRRQHRRGETLCGKETNEIADSLNRTIP
jgi:hypothetical protein